MKPLPRLVLSILVAAFAVAGAAPVAWAQCKVSTATRKFEGTERTIVTLENERILVEVAPDLEGRIITYRDKQRAGSPFECLDDCPYHYGARWEGKPFSYRVDDKGPQRAAVTVTGGGKIAVAMMRYATGNDVASPVELKVERTMTIEAGSTRLQVAVKFTNVGDGVAPRFRNMVHAVYGNIPPMREGRAFWFLPTAGGVEFFDPVRGNAEMWQASGGAPVDHPFSRFTPGLKADKPRYESGGWGAVLTSFGPAYIFYDAAKYDFMQFWFGGDSEWHFTFEPHSKAQDLKPGESVTNVFTLAYDSKDVPFAGTTVAYERPQIPEALSPGDTLELKARATTAQAKDEAVKVTFNVKNAKGESVLAKTADGTVKPFIFTPLAATVKLPDNAGVGMYAWDMLGPDGKVLANGKFEVVSIQELAKRKMDKATSELRKKLQDSNQDLSAKQTELRQMTELWRSDANLALSFQDPTAWPTRVPAAPVAMSTRENAVPVLGLWHAKELPRITALARAAATALPADAGALLAGLKTDRALVHDMAATADGKGLVVLIWDPVRKRTEIVTLTPGAPPRHFGRFAEKPAETDDSLGANCRGLVVDADGNVWVATNTWGQTSVFSRGADGAPFETTVIGDKGAVKKFAADGRLLGTVSLLTAPLDLTLAVLAGKPVIVAGYRHVSAYHGAQVREGAMVIAVDGAKRVGELKLPGGSVAIDGAGRVWVGDVAGHVACYTVSGKKLLDVKDTPPPAVPDAVLPASSPLPAVLRAGANGEVMALLVLKRSLLRVNAEGQAVAQEVGAEAGALWKLADSAGQPVVLGDKDVWRPAAGR